MTDIGTEPAVVKDYCFYCGEWLRYDLGAWVDSVLDDECPGDDVGNNEYGEHLPNNS
jgi:hypothetical protein